jgi:hypothetical protein
MEISQTMHVLGWVLLGVLATAGAVYAFMEYRLYLLRTSVTKVPGGLLFKSLPFECEIHRTNREVLVRAKNANWTRQAIDGGTPEAFSGPLDLALPAPGIQIDVTPAEHLTPPGRATDCFIEIKASDALTLQAAGKRGGQQWVVTLPHIPLSIGADFQQFANQIALWVEKIEQGLQAEVQERQQKAEEAAKAEAAAKAGLAPPDPTAQMTPEQKVEFQIAKWRAAAGFTGTVSEIGLKPNGTIDWFVDLDPRGRVTLHANQRTFHGSLRGARIAALGGELEVEVRDDFWSKEDPALAAFLILRGKSAEVRSSWKDWLNAARESLGPDPDA